MAVSTAKLLTEQFYEWECKGRGHTSVDYPAELEPPFIPFFGHFPDAPYVNDGKRHTFLSRVKEYFVPEHEVFVPETPVQEVTAFPDTEEETELTIYSITFPKHYACKPDALEHCLNMLALCKLTMGFEIIAKASDILVQIVCRDDTATFIHTQLKAYFPECAIRETFEDEVLNCADDAESVYMIDFGLREEFMRPIAMYGNGHHDPYTSLFGTFERLRDDEAVIVQVLFCGTQNPWSESIITAVSDERGGSFFVDAPEMPALAKEKVSRPLFAATVRMAAFAEYRDEATELLHHAALALMQASTSQGNALLPLTDPQYTIQRRLHDLVLRKSHRLGMLLNTRELATLAHFPNAQLSKKLIKNQRATKQAPACLQGQPYELGTNEHQGQSATVGIDNVQRLKHLHILGGTGTGKSTLLHGLICQDMRQGRGCCVLDPHGDLINAVLRSIPQERFNDVLVIDPSDSEFPVGFNILSAHSDLERELLASDLVALFKRFSTSWGDQLHSVLANAIMAFLYNGTPGHLGDLRKFLIEPQFRSHILASCTDQELVYYWQKEYPLLKTSSIGSILTRLDSFLRPKAIRNMVCQHRGLDFSEMMDNKKIILVKLSQGLIGAENSHLLGAVIVSKLQQSAMARQQQSVASRQPFFCYIDEFHNFVTPSMNTILSGARKYSFGLVLAHQDMAQVQRHDADIAGSLMSNVGTRICFRLSDTDAKRMQEGFGSFTAEDLQNLAVGEAVARVNTADADFNLSVQLSQEQESDYTLEIIAASRACYSVPMYNPVSPEQKREQTQAPVAEPIPHERPTSSTAPVEREPLSKQSTRSIQEHRYIQNFIKTMAEQHGYKANIEVQTTDGKGHVDVVLEKGNELIAVEVSVSTDAEWELHNIEKCLKGKYSKIVVCSNDQKKLHRIRQKITQTCTTEQQSRIAFVTVEDIPTLFPAPERAQGTTTTVKGYRVKVKYDEDPYDSNAQDIIQRIIKGGTKQ